MSPTATRRWDFLCFVVVSLNSISTTDTPSGGYGIRPYGLPIPLHSACRQLRRGGGTPPYILPKKGNVGRPALWPPCPLPATVNLPCNPPHPHPAGLKTSFDKGGRTVEKLHPCLIACVGATIGRPSAYRRNAISGTVFIHGKRARASNARPYKSVSTRCPNLKLHFKFHSCKIRQSVLQSHSIPF